jgi:hypothetical protein
VFNKLEYNVILEVNMSKNIHLLLRYSDQLYKTNTYNEHKKIEALLGYVWWGKFGLGISPKIADEILQQVKNGSRTYLFLSHSTYLKYQAEIIGLLGGGENFDKSPEDINAIPEYYRHQKCSVWIKIKNLQPIDKKNVDDIRLYNNPEEKPKLGGMRPLMYVTIE